MTLGVAHVPRGGPMNGNDFPIGQRVSLPGHFGEPVVLEGVRPIGAGYECRVRLLDGTPDEAILSEDEAATLVGQKAGTTAKVQPADAEHVRLLVESARIRLAYAHDPHFVATESEEGQDIIEGRILERLLWKLDQMREVLADRVFDVIGEVLSLNDVNLPEMLREAAYDPRRLDEYLDLIEKVDPAKLRQYEQVTGIALARGSVDFSAFERANFEAEERRLMPRYVEDHFEKACRVVGLRVEPRADGLWRIEHVLADLRSDRLLAVKRLGKPKTEYRKVTFHKEHLEQDQHLDAEIMGPGHPLYAAVDERLGEVLAGEAGALAVFVDAAAHLPYRLHFFEMAIRGQSDKGRPEQLHGELVAVREELGAAADASGRFEVFPADCLLDLPTHPAPPAELDPVDPSPASDFLRSTYQTARRRKCQEERLRFVQVCREYLTDSFKARIRAAQDRVMALKRREQDSPEVALARQRARLAGAMHDRYQHTAFPPPPCPGPSSVSPIPLSPFPCPRPSDRGIGTGE